MNDNCSAGGEFSVVILADTTPPVVKPPEELKGTLTNEATVELGEATVTDNIDTNLSATPNPSNPIFSVGEHIVTWSATDSAGNTGQATQTINVVNAELVAPQTGATINSSTVNFNWTNALTDHPRNAPFVIPPIFNGSFK